LPALAKRQVIDIHAHLVPPELLQSAASTPVPGVEVTDHGGGKYSFTIAGVTTRVLPCRLIDIVERQEWMTSAGIDVQIVGTWADLFGYSLAPDAGIAWSRMLNETLLYAVEKVEGLEAFASLPMQAPEQAAAFVSELAEGPFLGVTFATQISGMELDDPALDVLWTALVDSGLPAFIHPGYVDSDARTTPYGMVNAVGRPLDTTIAAARILGAGIPMRFPGLKLILAHGGGAVPYILGRLKRNKEINPEVADPQTGFAAMAFDSVVFDPDALCYLVSKTSADSVMLGSDYPFPIGDHSPVDVVEKARCLESADRRSILGDAARALFDL
jgi:aminocarboxymuconate-semialdehyde decarboxylase